MKTKIYIISKNMNKKIMYIHSVNQETCKSGRVFIYFDLMQKLYLRFIAAAINVSFSGASHPLIMAWIEKAIFNYYVGGI